MGVSGFDDRNILGLFDVSAEDAFMKSWSSTLGFMNNDSDRGAEEYGILGANSAMREWIGARQAQILRKKEYTINNAKYESTMVAPKEEVERDKTGLLEARMGTFARDAVAGHWEDLITDLITDNGTCYDGIAFFSAAHVWGDSGTQKNLVTASEIASLNVTTATAPTPVEMAKAILGMTAHMQQFKNDKGRYINGSLRSFTVMCGTVDLYQAAVQAVASERLSDSGQIDNPLRGMTMGGFTYNVVPNYDLSSQTTNVYLFANDGPLAPFILQSEQDPELSVLGPGSDFYFDNDAYKVGVNARRGAGYGFWEQAIKATLS